MQEPGLPLKPDPVTIEGNLVRLVPYNRELHSESLFKFSNGSAIDLGHKSIGAYDSNDLIWKYMFKGPFPDLDSFSAFTDTVAMSPKNLLMCIIDKATNLPIGVNCMMNNDPENKIIELGHIWLSPIAQRTGANLETCYLLLCHLFNLGYKRVEWKCNSLNKRSREAAEKIGFKFEIVQKKHFIIKNCNRDTAWFSIISPEWEETRKRLHSKIYERSN